MFSTINNIGIFIFALCITGTICKLPSTIKICSRNEPNLSQCILNSINDLRPRLATGDLGDGLKTVPIEPMNLGKIHFKRGPDFIATFINNSFSGPSNFIVTNLKPDIEKLQFNFTILLPKLNFVGKYSLKMRLLLLNINGRGPINGVLDNTRANVTLTVKKVFNKETGVENIRLDTLKIKGSVEGGRFRLDNLFEGDRILGDIGNTIINDNAMIFIDEMLPGFEKELAKKFTEIANDILTDVTFDEMFPDI